MPRPNRGPRSFDKYEGFPKSTDLQLIISFTRSGSVMHNICMLPVEYVNTGPAHHSP